MRILVTGATGFLGSWLVADLVAREHEVAALVRPSSDTWRIAKVADQVQIVMPPIDDRQGLAEVLYKFRPEAIAHLAWRGVDNIDRNDPLQARNMSATVEFVDMAAAAGVRIFVGAGSQAEYGPYPRAIREDDQPRPSTLYGHSKLAAGNMAGLVAAERNLRFAWLRIFSVYGPKDSPRWLIPSLIKSLKAGERMALTACEQLWGFIHARGSGYFDCATISNQISATAHVVLFKPISQPLLSPNGGSFCIFTCLDNNITIIFE